MTVPSKSHVAQWRNLRPMLALCAGLDFLMALWPVVVRHEPFRDWRSLAGGVVTGVLAWVFHLKVKAAEKGTP